MKEIIICVDKDDNEIGYIEKIDAHIKGVLHRALSIFILPYFSICYNFF